MGWKIATVALACVLAGAIGLGAWQLTAERAQIHSQGLRITALQSITGTSRLAATVGVLKIDTGVDGEHISTLESEIKSLAGISQTQSAGVDSVVQSELLSLKDNVSSLQSTVSCFQAAIAALQREGIGPPREQWGHAFVQAQFAEQLIRRRKRYPSELRVVLPQTLALRQAADYHEDWVSQRDAFRVLRWTRALVEAIQQGGERP